MIIGSEFKERSRKKAFYKPFSCPIQQAPAFFSFCSFSAEYHFFSKDNTSTAGRPFMAITICRTAATAATATKGLLGRQLIAAGLFLVHNLLRPHGHVHDIGRVETKSAFYGSATRHMSSLSITLIALFSTRKK
jgi:hypothetical protein